MRVTGLLGLMALGLLVSAAAAEDKEKLDPAKLVGTWTYVSGEKDGKKIPADDHCRGDAPGREGWAVSMPADYRNQNRCLFWLIGGRPHLSRVIAFSGGRETRS